MNSTKSVQGQLLATANSEILAEGSVDIVLSQPSYLGDRPEYKVTLIVDSITAQGCRHLTEIQALRLGYQTFCPDFTGADG